MKTSAGARVLTLFLTLFCALAARAQQGPAGAPPPAPSPAVRAADALFNAQKWAEAAKAYESVTKDEPANARAWYRLGVALHSLGKYAEAAPLFEKASELGKALPVAPFAMYNAGAARARLGEREKALGWLGRAVAANPLAARQLAADADYESVRADARYKELALAVDKSARPCMYAEGFRQFDFWVGEWDVLSPQGQRLGTSSEKLLHDGCTVQETWTAGNGSGTGVSLSAYNPVTRKWHQTYVGNGGATWMLDGEYKDGAMRFEGVIYAPSGQTPTRVVFYNLGPDKVRHTAETSPDGGKTWTNVWDSTYVRKK